MIFMPTVFLYEDFVCSCKLSEAVGKTCPNKYQSYSMYLCPIHVGYRVSLLCLHFFTLEALFLIFINCTFYILSLVFDQ
jgi:hypothetical protein